MTFKGNNTSITHVVVQLLSCVQLFATPWAAAHQASLPFTVSQSLLRFMSIDSVMRLTISSSATRFCFCPLSFPASGSFLVSRPFASGSQSIGASASTSVLAVNIQDWFPEYWKNHSFDYTNFCLQSDVSAFEYAV